MFMEPQSALREEGKMEQLIFLMALLCLGYIAGTIAERRHYRSIEAREKQLLHLPAVTARKIIPDDRAIEKAEIVQGSAVISVDYFKRMLAGLRNIFGGKVKAYESLVDRARREATIRMKESAMNSHVILNTRIETAAVGKSVDKRNSVGSIEAIAYGTAITYRK